MSAAAAAFVGCATTKTAHKVSALSVCPPLWAATRRSRVDWHRLTRPKDPSDAYRDRTGLRRRRRLRRRRPTQHNRPRSGRNSLEIWAECADGPMRVARKVHIYVYVCAFVCARLQVCVCASASACECVGAIERTNRRPRALAVAAESGALMCDGSARAQNCAQECAKLCTVLHRKCTRNARAH